MSATVVAPKRPAADERAPLRPYHCPRCGRYMFATSVPPVGVVRQYCRGGRCGKWLLIDLATGKEVSERS